MTVTKELLISHFSERFLDLKEKNVKKLSDILDLPTSFMKGVTPLEEDVLKNYKVENIRDLGRLDTGEIKEIVENSKIDQITIDKMIIAARLVSRAWRKRKSYDETEISKIVVVGLDNAGKSSLIAALSGEDISKIVNQEPTTMVHQIEIESQKMKFVMWDFGGQIQHREQYLTTPENYFLGLDHLMLVLDVQEPGRYHEAIQYFTKILEVIDYIGEKPLCQLLLHKADPDLMEDPELQINLEYLHEKLAELMKSYQLDYEIVHSSIYKMYQNQPIFAQYLKDFFKQEQHEESNLLVVDAVMRVTEMIAQVGNELANQMLELKTMMGKLLERDIKTIHEPKKADTGKSFGGDDYRPLPPSQMPRPRGGGSPEGANRMELMAELKEMFRKRKLLSEE